MEVKLLTPLEGILDAVRKSTTPGIACMFAKEGEKKQDVYDFRKGACMYV
jgi:hypothetical protein